MDRVLAETALSTEHCAKSDSQERQTNRVDMHAMVTRPGDDHCHFKCECGQLRSVTFEHLFDRFGVDDSRPPMA